MYVCKTGGSKRTLSERDRCRIVKAASNSMKSLSQISADCGVKVSNSTISRMLNESGTITRQSLMTVPRLLTRHKTARMEFAKKNLQTNWSQVSKYFNFFFMYTYYNWLPSLLDDFFQTRKNLILTVQMVSVDMGWICERNNDISLNEISVAVP